MKILFKEFINKFLLIREFRENIIFTMIMLILINTILNKNIMLISILSSVINLNIVIMAFLFVVSFVINMTKQPSYTNAFTRHILEINKVWSMIFHIGKFIFIQLALTISLMFWDVVNLNKYEILIFIIYNSLNLCMSMKYVLTLITYFVSVICFIILMNINHSLIIITVFSLIGVIITYFVYKYSNSKNILFYRNNIYFLPQNKFCESFVLVLRNSKIYKLMLIFTILQVFYFLIPYDNHFDLIKWMEHNSTFVSNTKFHFPLIFFILLTIVYIIQYKLCFVSFKTEKLYVIQNPKYYLHKFIITYLLLVIVYEMNLLTILHIEHNQYLLLYKSQQHNITNNLFTNINILLVQHFILSLLAINKNRFNTIMKLIIFGFIIYIFFSPQFIYIMLSWKTTIIVIICIVVVLFWLNNERVWGKKNEYCL